VIASQSIIFAAGQSLTHAEACRLAEKAAARGSQTVVLDLSACVDATTAAFARIVLLRRHLLHTGRDLSLAGLHGRPARLFEVHRLDSVLPQLSEMPMPAAAPRQMRPRRATPALAAAC